MIDDQSSNDFYRATVRINPNRFALELANGFELGPGDDCNGSAGNVAGYNFDRQPPDRRGNSGTDGSLIVYFSTD